MLSWEWLSTWWYEMGAKEPGVRNRLLIAIVTDAADQVLGIAPFYLQTSWRGQTLRLLGDGDVCSDYLRILGLPESEAEVARTLARWIGSAEFAQEFGPLDLLLAEGYSAHDTSWQAMWREFQAVGWSVDTKPIESSWVLCLNGTLDQVQRKGRDSLRRKNKALLKLVDVSEVEIEQVNDIYHFELAWPEFVRLHQQRRQQLGQPGCFASPHFERFLHDATRRLIEQGRARLWFATKQGIRFAAILTLATDSKLMLYQSGMDNSVVTHDPGHLCNAYLIRWAHDQGLREYDFLRGDEPYKKHLGAEPRAMLRTRAVAPNWSARTKACLYQLAKKTKQRSGTVWDWVRQASAFKSNS
jgi:hypothetical protein